MKPLDLSYRIAGGEVLKLLDLFCGGGGAAMGYSRAGFDVTGIDNRPQPRYPFTFIQADALEYVREHGHEYDVIHASPPCQAYSTMTRGLWKDREHPELIDETRKALVATGKPYVIENVAGARRGLQAPVMLCGTMFDLKAGDGAQLRRHRYFECPWSLLLTPPCNHNGYNPIAVYGGGQNKDYHNPPRKPKTIGVWGHAGGTSVREQLTYHTIDDRRVAMGIDWMTSDELSEAIPPAYTEWIGRRLLEAVACSR